MDIKLLVKVTSKAWSLKILALMHLGIPGRQASLLSASGAGRTAFTQSLVHLIGLGLLERNPGHGHPLRPEYRLTESGIEPAKFAAKLEKNTIQSISNALLRRAWTIPILAVSTKPRYFCEIKTDLAPVTDRALSQSLKLLQANCLLQRNVSADIYPPRPTYQATNIGVQIGKAINLEAIKPKPDVAVYGYPGKS